MNNIFTDGAVVAGGIVILTALFIFTAGEKQQTIVNNKDTRPEQQMCIEDYSEDGNTIHWRIPGKCLKYFIPSCKE